MGLLHQIHALRREVTAPRSQRLYEEHARSEPALCVYGSVEDLLTALEARDEASYRVREEALRALDAQVFEGSSRRSPGSTRTPTSR